MLHFHGGGYLCGTAAETDLTSSIPKSLVIHSPIHHVLSVDYRLAPSAPWPLPLLDAISAYRYLLDTGIPERDIVIGGDSAGGHLALALVRWIRDEGGSLGMRGPRGLVVMSPWVDVGLTAAWGAEHRNRNADSDTVSTVTLIALIVRLTIHLGLLRPRCYSVAYQHLSCTLRPTFPPHHYSFLLRRLDQTHWKASHQLT